MDETEKIATQPSLEATKAVAEIIRDYIQMDDEGELDAFDKLTIVGQSVTIKVTDADDIDYLVTVTPAP